MNKMQRTFLIVLAAVLVPLSVLAVVHLRGGGDSADEAGYRKYLAATAPDMSDPDDVVRVAKERCADDKDVTGFTAALMADDPETTYQLWTIVRKGFEFMCPSKSDQWAKLAAQYGH